MQNCNEEFLDSYLKLAVNMNDMKLLKVLEEIKEREAVSQKEAGSTKCESSFLDRSLETLRDRVKILEEAREMLSSEKGKKDAALLYQYLLGRGYEYFLIERAGPSIVGLTRNIDFIYIDRSFHEFSWDFGRFSISLTLKPCFCCDNNRSDLTGVIKCEKITDKKWEKIKKEQNLRHDHPHINTNGSPCLGTGVFPGLFSDCYNKSMYFDIFWVLEESFLRSFNPGSCFGLLAGSGGDFWRELFSRKGRRVRGSGHQESLPGIISEEE